MREDLIYGIHVIQHLLATKPEHILELYVADTRQKDRVSPIFAMAGEMGIAIKIITKKQIDTWLKDVNHQGIAAKVKGSPLRSLTDLLEHLKAMHEPPLLLVLDGIQDPHNLGAILRTAEAVGVTAVLIPKDRSVGLTPIVRKVASGAAETLYIVQVTNLVRALEQLKEQGIWIIGTSSIASQSLYNSDLRFPTALVFGSEGSGLRRLTEEHCDALIKIPMTGAVESLNISVAAGICLYEALRQREKT